MNGDSEAMQIMYSNLEAWILNDASEAVQWTLPDMSSFVPCEQSQALPPAAIGGASEAVLWTPADISSFEPCEQSQALPLQAVGGASEAVERRTADEIVPLVPSALRPAVMKGASPDAKVRMGGILEQIRVEHSTQDQLVHNNNNIINNRITASTNGEGWRVVQPPPLDKKATQQDKERCKRSQSFPPPATGGAPEAVQRRTVNEIVSFGQSEALRPAVMNGASPDEISEQIPVEQTTQDQLMYNNNNIINNEITTSTSGEGWRGLQQPPLEQSQSFPQAATGGASEAVQRRTDEIVSFGQSEALRLAVMNGASPDEISEQIVVEQTTQDQLVYNNNSIINNGITTSTNGEGWRVVQPPPLDKKATQQDKEKCKRAAESIARSNVDSTLPTDYTSEFTRNEKFKSREDLIEWARDVGRSNGFHIVTLRSDNGKGNKRPRVTLGCERSGKYDSRPPKKEIQSKDRTHTGTKKCDCPFQLKGNKLDTDWQLTVVKGKHNHPVEYLEVDRSFLGGFSSLREKDDIEPLGETAESSGVNERMKGQMLSKKMNTSTHFALPSSDIIVESAQHNSTTCGSLILHSKKGRQLEEKVFCFSFKYVGVCPSVMRPYILDIQDVASDGHCGFRAVASLLGDSNEDGWIKVRKDLKKELGFYSAQYTQLFKSETKVDELRHALEYDGHTCLYQKEYWMKMPDMGHLIASRYNVVLMHFSSAQCRTYFPLRSVPLSSPKEMAIGLVNEHFVQLFLKQGHPMPPIAEDWKRYNEDNQSFIKEWTTPYDARIKHFMYLQPEIYGKF